MSNIEIVGAYPKFGLYHDRTIEFQGLFWNKPNPIGFLAPAKVGMESEKTKEL